MTRPLSASPENQPRRPGAATPGHPAARLGDREREVLELVWASGSATVHQVSRGLPVRLAYTTVMTTLDRLFKKGLLRREQRDRAFHYIPACSPYDVESGRALALVQRLFAKRPSSKDMLLSCLVDAIGTYDDAMLDELERKVRAARERLGATHSEPGDGSPGES